MKNFEKELYVKFMDKILDVCADVCPQFFKCCEDASPVETMLALAMCVGLIELIIADSLEGEHDLSDVHVKVVEAYAVITKQPIFKAAAMHLKETRETNEEE